MQRLQVAFYKGRSRLFNRLTAWWTRGPYSHCELIVGRVCWSSSFMDGGVRGKVIELDPDHWDVVDIAVPEPVAAAAVAWFIERQGQRYDVLGLIGCVWRALRDDQAKWFCSEAVAAALGYVDAWRFDPNTFYAALQYQPKFNADGGANV